METRRTNWSIWAGFLLSVVAAASYFLLFSRFPTTRDVPWVNFLLFGLAAGLLGLGLRRAFVNQLVYRGKVAGPVLAVASIAIFAFLVSRSSLLPNGFRHRRIPLIWAKKCQNSGFKTRQAD